jgi:oxalate decarboxylase/phosphoglucose isomerase-like protein (cupin superfamily)
MAISTCVNVSRVSNPLRKPGGDGGFGDYVRQIGNEETQILVALNSPDYQEISISAWLAANPPRLLADNFGLEMSVIEKLPRASQFIVA